MNLADELDGFGGDVDRLRRRWAAADEQIRGRIAALTQDMNEWRMRCARLADRVAELEAQMADVDDTTAADGPQEAAVTLDIHDGTLGVTSVTSDDDEEETNGEMG